MYRRLMEHLTTAVLLLDGELRLRWMNPAAEALLALSLSRLQGQPLPDLVEGRRTSAGCWPRPATSSTPSPSARRA